MNRLTDQQARFISFLENQREANGGRANLAELRRAAMNPLGDFRDVRILNQHLPDGDDWTFDAHRLTAVLFALYSTKFWEDGKLRLPSFGKGDKRRSLGTSLQLLKRELERKNKAGIESLDLRFSALLDTPTEDLAVPLRSLIQRIATSQKDLPLDFGHLLIDLLRWDADETRRRWAREYWQSSFYGETADDASLTEA